MHLKEIKKENIILNSDTINTELILNDYDWMDYSLSINLHTKDMGPLNILFHYFGMVDSIMEVEYTLNNTLQKVTYEYSTDIFKDYIIKFLNKHILSWDDEFAFSGEDIAIEFYNTVIKMGHIIPNR